MGNNIGILKESSLHKYLKFQYSDTGKTEISVGDYVCDGQNKKGELIEVQTGSFGPLKEKINTISKKKKIRIIYPVIIRKHIELYDTDGKLMRKKKSPKKGNIWDIFDALIYAPDLCLARNVTLELALLDIVEKRVNDGKGSWKRKGITIEDKIPLCLHESIILKKPGDYFHFIPFEKDAEFTVKDLGEKAGIPLHLANKCIYVLKKSGLIEKTGKQGRAFLYKKKRTKV